MEKTFALILSIYCFFVADVYAQNITKTDTTFHVGRLSPKESQIIRNLVNTDTTFIPPIHSNLHAELLRYDASLLYKYRLDSISSAIPLDHNSHVQSYIDAFVKQGTRQIARMISLGNYYFPIFEKALKEHNVPDEFKYLTIVESAMDPHAVSKSGATGLWQFMHTTAIGYGLVIDNYIDERKDPISSSYAAASYLRTAYNEFGDWLLAMASYNCGMGAVKRTLQRAGGDNKTFWDIQHLLPVETQNYVPKFIAVTYMMNYFHHHNKAEIPELHFKIDIDSVYVNRFVSFNSLAEALQMEEKELQILNPSYKKEVVNGSLSSPKRLIIPKVSYKSYASLFDVLHNDDYQQEEISVETASVIEQQLPVYHTVERGETLTRIATNYRIEVQDIKVWNDLKNYNIFPGQKLKVGIERSEQISQVSSKSPGFISYTVKAGDTLTSIARQFQGVSVSALQEWNNLTSHILTIGEILKIKKTVFE